MPPKVVTSSKSAQTLTAWSYSTYTAYIRCPLSIFFEKILRIRIAEPPNPHFEKGNLVHKAAEEHITAKKAPKLIPELASVTTHLKLFRKLKAAVEQEWTFDNAFNITSWFAPNAWLRMKVDVCAVEPKEALVQIVDWKTGRIHDEHKQQRSLYALGGLQLIQLGQLLPPELKKAAKITVEHVYTDTTQAAKEEFTMKQLKPLKDEWLRRIRTMMMDTKFPSKPGFHCRYCKFRKSNGGPCKENQ